jgi:hypothetical protein
MALQKDYHLGWVRNLALLLLSKETGHPLARRNLF